MTDMNGNYQPPQAPQTPPTQGKAIAALVCGILGIIGGWFPIVQYFTFILAIVGIVLGVKARKESAAYGAPTGMATAGLVLGIIGTVLGAIGIVCVICAAGILGAAAYAGY